MRDRFAEKVSRGHNPEDEIQEQHDRQPADAVKRNAAA
jgi:hypothetical protein